MIVKVIGLASEFAGALKVTQVLLQFLNLGKRQQHLRRPTVPSGGANDRPSHSTTPLRRS